MANLYSQKLLSFVITLAPKPGTPQPATFAGSGGANTVTLQNVRASVQISASGAFVSTAEARIYGLTPDLMNQLTALGMQQNQVPFNVMTILAGDATTGQSVIFTGNINFAYGEYERAPDVPMFFDLVAGGAAAIQAIPPASFPGQTDVATVMANFARALGVGFENGLTQSVAMPASYHPGTLLDQIKSYARMANIHADLVDGMTKLAIWPINGTRKSTTTMPVLSPTSGMIGYPSFTLAGVIVKSVFNPLITMGSSFRIQSSLPRANGTWSVVVMDLSLETLTPDGQWVQTIHAQNPNYATPAPALK